LNSSFLNKYKDEKNQNPFTYNKENSKENNNKQHLLFSEIRDNSRLNETIKNENANKINENSRLKENSLSIEFRHLDYIQSRPRNLYNNINKYISKSIGNEITNFFFENNHHLIYENEIEKVKIFLVYFLKLVEKNF